MPENLTFDQEIQDNKTAEIVPAHTTEITNGRSSLDIRHRGCFIVGCELVSPSTDDKVSVLHAAPDHNIAKLTASHSMSPVGPSEGIGGQHGFPRWADYHEFAQNDGPNGEKCAAFQAIRSDNGLGLTKVFELTEGTLYSDATIYNSEPHPVQTSIGEHYYFTLPNENITGLTINGSTLNELLGDEAESRILLGEPFFWPAFEGEAEIAFPAGHRIRLLAASIDNEAQPKLGMLIWHRPGSPSICFEPTIGFNMDTSQSDGIKLPPYTSATLSSKIELL